MLPEHYLSARSLAQTQAISSIQQTAKAAQWQAALNTVTTTPTPSKATAQYELVAYDINLIPSKIFQRWPTLADKLDPHYKFRTTRMRETDESSQELYDELIKFIQLNDHKFLFANPSAHMTIVITVLTVIFQQMAIEMHTNAELQKFIQFNAGQYTHRFWKLLVTRLSASNANNICARLRERINEGQEKLK